MNRKDVEQLIRELDRDGTHLDDGTFEFEIVQALLSDIDKAREALEFYAKWLPKCEHESGGVTTHTLVAPLAIDTGDLAKQALAQIERWKK